MNIFQNLQVVGLAHYLRAVQRTSQVSIVRSTEESALVTFWHDAMLPLLAATMGANNVAIYVQAHPLMQDTLDFLEYLGLRTFVSDRQSSASVKAARHWLSVPGRLLAVTLDAAEPQVALPGVARLARMLGVPLCPLAVAASRGYRMRRRDRCVVPHLGGQLTVRALPPVSEMSVEATTGAVQRALSASTLAEPTSGELLPWRRAFEVLPRLCLMPRTRGKVTVWPATEPSTLTF